MWGYIEVLLGYLVGIRIFSRNSYTFAHSQADNANYNYSTSMLVAH